MTHFRQLIVVTSLLISMIPYGFAGPAHRCEGLFRAKSYLDFHTNQDLRVISMKPSLVKPRVLGSVGRFLESLKTVRAGIRELKVPAEMMTTILYPMSGFDLTTPMRLFPEAETYLLVDNHTLMRADQVSSLSRRILETEYLDRNGRWIRYDETGSNIFSKLMTALFATMPSAKVDTIEFITDSLDYVSAKIVFTDTNSGQTKTVFYLAGEIGDVNFEAKAAADRDEAYSSTPRSPHTENWWDDMVAELAPRTLLLKGSMSALRPTAHEKQSPGRERVLLPLLSFGGLVVEGASQLTAIQDAEWAKKLKPERDRWELTDGDPRLQKPIRERVFREVEFSYSGNVRIALYEPQKLGRPRR